MKFRLLFPLLLSILMVGVSCQQATKKPGAKAATSTTAKAKKVSKKAKAKAAKKKLSKKYWAGVTKKAGLSASQVKAIQTIEKKYATNITGLKKSKRWDGDANKVTRTNMMNNKKNEIKNVLGSKTAAFDKFNKKWKANLKKAKKKGKKAKKN